jgi:hypothetical protein
LSFSLLVTNFVLRLWVAIEEYEEGQFLYRHRKLKDSISPS